MAKIFNPFKDSYKIVRYNSKQIYKGFGFQHLSDVTQYYVHPDNQSYNGKTTVCQPIGESIILFATMLMEIAKGNFIGDYCISNNKKIVFLEINIPDDYRTNKVVDDNIYRYRTVCNEDKIFIGAYNAAGIWINGNPNDMTELYKLLPVFMCLLAKEIELNPDYKILMDRFLECPVADLFVNLHEDFYQLHKNEEYIFEYLNVPQIKAQDKASFKYYSEAFLTSSDSESEPEHEGEPATETTKTKKRTPQKESAVKINKFSEDSFSEEQKSFIPNLSEEFVLPDNLISICNAVASGDMLSVLFHGPAGTGKTISCKLTAQAIGLPIMETINCTENLDEFVLGKYIPQDDRIIFKESFVTKAVREGGAVVFEEINFARPQYLAFLNSLLDDNGFVRLDNGDIVRRHKNFRFFATMNIGYFGTKELNQSLYNRFNGIIEISALSDEAIKRMLVTRVPECKPSVEKILGVYHKLKKKIEAEELDVVISPRNLENWAKLAKYEGYVSAAEKTIIPIAKCDRALEETIRGILILYKWNQTKK